MASLRSELFSTTFLLNLAEIESHVRDVKVSDTECKEHGWNVKDHSPHITVTEDSLVAVKNNGGEIEGVRSHHEYNDGIHFFEVSWNPRSNGNVVIGIATNSAELTGNSMIVGADDQSVGWNLSTRKIIFNGCSIKTYPTMDAKIPKVFTLVLNMEKGTLSFKNNTVEFGIAQSGLKHIANAFHIAAALDEAGDQIAIKYLGSSDNIKPNSMKMEGSIIVAPLSFDTVCSKNAQVEGGQRKASRKSPFNDYGYATVLTNRPLRNGEFFRIRIDSVSSGIWKKSIQIGATTNTPSHLRFPENMSQCGEGKTWVFSGQNITHKGRMLEELNGDLRELKKGETTGMKIENSKLQFYVNGYRQCSIPLETDEQLYGFVDIYGQVIAVSMIDGDYKVQESLEDQAGELDGLRTPRNVEEFCVIMQGALTLMVKKDTHAIPRVQKVINKLFKVHCRGLKPKQQALVADNLAHCDGAKIICNYLEMLTTLIDKNSDAAICYHLLRDLCFNFSDDSFLLCKKLGEAGILTDCVQDMNKLKCLYQVDKRAHNLLKSAMGIIANCSEVSENRHRLRKLKYIKEAQEYLNPDETAMWACMNSLITMSYICEDDETSLLATPKVVAETMIECLKNALREESHSHGGWTAVELVTGIFKLTEHFDNITVFVDSGIIRHLVKMLDIGNELESEHAMNLIWSLMLDHNKEAIMKTSGMREILGQIEGSSNVHLKQAAVRIKINAMLSHEEKQTYKKSPPNCSYMEQCKAFLDRLKLSDYYFDTEYDCCYCVHCHSHRGDKTKYARGKPRKDYGVPVGWCRFGLATPPKAKALDVFTKWHRAYHGTKKEYIKGILQVGEIVPAGRAVVGGGHIKEQPGHFTDDRKPTGFDTKQVFLSPSIRYSGVDAYATPSRFFDNKAGKNSEQYLAKVALQVVIDPTSYIVGAETIGARSEIDPGFRNEEMEWSTNLQGSLILYGILVKLDKH